jgi:hypothetical protein
LFGAKKRMKMKATTRDRSEHGLAVAEALRDDTVGEQAQNLAAVHGVGKAGLPRGAHLVGAVGLKVAVLLLE